MKFFLRGGVVWMFLLLFFRPGVAQGPPITGDKPIMAGSNSWTFRNLTEIRHTERGDFLRLPLELDYIPVSNFLVGVQLPLVRRFGAEPTTALRLGDLQLIGKYQFLRRDQTGRTFRMVGKIVQSLPTGPALNAEGISMGRYMGYYGSVAALETTKYGISGELGYRIDGGGDMDELRTRLGFGLPLLKPVYPVKQINLFFEYRSSWFTTADEYLLLYAQGIQYAVGQFTIEGAVQFPLTEANVSQSRQRDYSVFLGARYAF